MPSEAATAPPAVDVTFAAGISTRVEVIDAVLDLAGVDRAIAVLTTHSIIGVDVKWNTLQSGQDKPLCLMTLSNGEATYLMRLQAGRRLPMAVSLLMTHQDYVKVGFNLTEDKIGKLNEDCEIVPQPLYDAKDCTRDHCGTDDLQSAFRQMFKNADVNFPPTIQDTDWEAPRLSTREVTYAAFVPMAARALWLDIAKPVNFPPETRFTPVDGHSVLASLVCPVCKEQFASKSKLEDHYAENHRHPCPCCDFIGTTREALSSHIEMEHVICPDCGEVIVSSAACRAHEAEKHMIPCKAGCGETFRSEGAMHVHCDAHHSKCPVCGDWMLTERDLALHLELQHPVCGQCGRHFASLEELRRHVYARVNSLCYPHEAATAATYVRTGADPAEPSVLALPEPGDARDAGRKRDGADDEYGSDIDFDPDDDSDGLEHGHNHSHSHSHGHNHSHSHGHNHSHSHEGGQRQGRRQGARGGVRGRGGARGALGSVSSLDRSLMHRSFSDDHATHNHLLCGTTSAQHPAAHPPYVHNALPRGPSQGANSSFQGANRPIVQESSYEAEESQRYYSHSHHRSRTAADTSVYNSISLLGGRHSAPVPRIPPAMPGDVRWIPPPSQMPVKLKLAKDANSVGLYG